MNEEQYRHVDVVVVGAGIAGLAAGRSLAESGLRVVLLEATERVGGRIRTVRVGEQIIELGAEFVHGRPPELWGLIEEAGLETYERTGSFFRLEGDRLVSENEQEDDEDDALERLKDYSGEDEPFVRYVDRLGLSSVEREESIGYVEGFNAADAREASITALGQQQVAEDAIEGDRLWRITDGYDSLPEFLRARFEAAGGTIVFGAIVAEVTWERGRVTMQTSSGDFVAGKAVLTLPLGVLQAGAVRFSPPPESILNAARRMRMGHVCRFTMVFRKRLWPQSMSFLLSRTMTPAVWWTARPADDLTLTGWAGGPQAADLVALEASNLESHACASLAKALHLDVVQVKEGLAGFYTHDWTHDEHSRGAYSWVPVGGLYASAQMCEPVEDTLFFAGEHTDTTGHWGTVHAAFGTGLRAAKQVLSLTSLP